MPMTSTLTDPRWTSVLQRDPAADGQFVYSVRSTGVYCRPTCPSRRPNPANVGFYSDAAAAEAAGFRPCRRCHPHGQAPREHMAEMIAAACRMLETAEEIPQLPQLAAYIGLSPSHLQREFRRLTGLTPRQWALARRDQRLREGLHSQPNVTSAIQQAGFSSTSRFYERADQALGMSPQQWRRGGQGSRIRFALGTSSLGEVLVARSDRGICAILLGDDADSLLRELQDRFPKAEMIGGDTGFEKLVAQVVALVERPDQAQSLPLDIRGTAFQRRVWQALSEIPPGTTVSYAELAHRIGAPSASRAVAQACGANALAVAIPCHRVVRQDGGVGRLSLGDSPQTGIAVT